MTAILLYRPRCKVSSMCMWCVATPAASPFRLSSCRGFFGSRARCQCDPRRACLVGQRSEIRPPRVCSRWMEATDQTSSVDKPRHFLTKRVEVMAYAFIKTGIHHSAVLLLNQRFNAAHAPS